MFYFLPLVIMLLVQNWFINLLLTVFSTISDMVTNMFSSEQLLFIAGTIALGFILYYIFNFIWRLERKNDVKFFILGDMIFMIFIYFFILFPEQVPDLISSLFIAELTLALVWVELSKRPELKLLDFIPIIHDTQTTMVYRADKFGRLSEPSKFLKIREASYEDLNFDRQFSFTVDLSNIGYTEIMVHEYIVYLDGDRQAPIPLWSRPKLERLKLVTQQRHTIDILSLYIENSGLHKIKVEVLATTVKCSKEIWFYISEDFRSLKYVEMAPYKHLLSRIVESKLNDGETR